ncbi:hypothetical protein J416_06318 [Gracilibacillus halophilus YIM-C55.5]|uniref:DUF1510 domain-containing protein n=1 Tax=Gracilibacillus halophilus YIM-C55.5 TaxID=1308866 RepID=N4WEE8_9BACI|nr:YrrS family protein [Gracilibacillus halophilus]ENH97604.1 hypothetical protein J416_06318 [Gracilibacillus halophilus YIM-C55.5]
MTEDYQTVSRKRRYQKQRTNTKAITWLSVIGSIVVLLGIWLIVFGGEEDKPQEDTEAMPEQEETPESNQDQSSSDEGIHPSESNDSVESEPDTSTEPNDETNQTQNNEVETEQVETEGENVISAYKGNWQPVGTVQEEPHQTTFEQDSVDWDEMLQAASVATDIPKDQLYDWYIQGAGEQKTIATVTPVDDYSEIYNVHLQWVENQGWQPTLVEKLNESEYVRESSNE